MTRARGIIQKEHLPLEDFSDSSELTASDDTSKKQSSLFNASFSSKTKHSPFVFGNIHIMVNRERRRVELPPYVRSPHLDDLAKEHAQLLAMEGKLEAQTRPRLVVKLKSKYSAENIGRGESVGAIHEMCMTLWPGHARNIMSRKYNEMGMGTAISKCDGLVYMVQFFRHNSEIAESMNLSELSEVTEALDAELQSCDQSLSC